MARIGVGRHSLARHPVAARVNLAGGCPICANVQFLYDFTAGRKRVSQCAGCGLVRVDAKSASEAANVSPLLSDNAKPANAPEFRLAPLTRELIAFAKNAYARPELRCAERTRVLVVGSSAGGANFEQFDILSVSIRQFIAGIVPKEALDLSFDIAIVERAIESIDEPLECLREIKHLLRPDGLLVLCAELLGVDPASPAGRKGLEDPGANFLYGFDQLRSLAFAAGFGEMKLHPMKDNAVQPATYSRSLAGKVALVARVRRSTSEVSGRQTVSIIMPAYNEKRTFSKVFELVYAKQLEGLDKEIIVVESNSTDGTRDDVLAVKDLPGVRILLQDRPQGKGYAVRAGLAEATGEYILVQDADLEYDIDDYDLLLEPLVSHRAAFVLGVRHGGDGGGWRMRRFNDQPFVSHALNLGQMFFTGMFNVVYGQSITDPFTMYKVFRRDCIMGLKFEANRFDFDWEITAKLVRRGYRPVEIPVNYVSRSFAEGKKVSLFRDPLTWIWACVKFRVVEVT